MGACWGERFGSLGQVRGRCCGGTIMIGRGLLPQHGSGCLSARAPHNALANPRGCHNRRVRGAPQRLIVDVVCPSEMEHRVGAVSSGTRASLNVDFWDVDAADDRRSEFDRY